MGTQTTKGGGPRLGPAGRELRERVRAGPDGPRLDEQMRVAVEAAANLGRALEETGVTRIELARRLGVNRSSVTRLLGGEENVSLARLAAAFHALGFSMHVDYGPPTDAPRVPPRRRKAVHLASDGKGGFRVRAR